MLFGIANNNRPSRLAQRGIFVSSGKTEQIAAEVTQLVDQIHIPDPAQWQYQRRVEGFCSVEQSREDFLMVLPERKENAPNCGIYNFDVKIDRAEEFAYDLVKSKEKHC